MNQMVVGVGREAGYHVPEVTNVALLFFMLKTNAIIKCQMLENKHGRRRIEWEKSESLLSQMRY